MASYSTIPAAEEPLVAKPQGKSLKALVAGAAVASFALGALAATAVSASVAAPTTSFISPMYVFNQKLGVTTFDECEAGCKKISGNGFKKGQMTIPCITSFDMNAQLLAWLQGKTGGREKGEKSFVWIGHKTEENGDDGKWVPEGCDAFQKKQYKGDMVNRNGCAFTGNLQKPECEGSTFDKTKGCAVLVNAKTNAGANSLGIPDGPISSYEQLHGNWIKVQCDIQDMPPLENLPNPERSSDETPIKCICQKTQP